MDVCCVPLWKYIDTKFYPLYLALMTLVGMS